MLLNMLEYYKMTRKLNVNVIYSGPIWAESIESMAVTLKKRMELDSLPLSVSQAIFSIFVEQTNNMLMYSAEQDNLCQGEDGTMTVSSGIFALGTKDKRYYMQAGNVIKKESADLISERIDYLNTLNKDELRSYYKKQIRTENTNPESKGGGIGLIEIARRASSKIEYTFEEYGDGLTFFSTFVQV